MMPRKPHTLPNEFGPRVGSPKAVFLDGPKGELAIRLALRLCEYPQALIRSELGVEVDIIPNNPCMVYFPTFTRKNQPNVGKYMIHGWYGHGNFRV